MPSKRFPHGIDTIEDLKEAIADYPDDAQILIQVVHSTGAPGSTCILDNPRISHGEPPQTVEFDAVEGNA